MTQRGAPPIPGLSRYAPLLSEIGNLKRVRAAALEGSVAAEIFRRSWAALIEGEGLDSTALSQTASALCAARLGAVDRAVLSGGGLDPKEARDVLLAGFDAVCAPLPETLRERLRDEVGAARRKPGYGALPPGFVGALARQPRAGATRPGRPRLMLEPPESHAEHCATVAVYGVALCEDFGAEPGTVFLAGLAHHLHNAGLPDAGFAGEELLGGYLDRVAGRFREAALAELPQTLRAQTEQALELARDAESPEARAFHAADVLDRVIQMLHYQRQSDFTLDQALEEMQLVHPGPLKDFQDAVLDRAGLT